jgi:subtilase family serine protease
MAATLFVFASLAGQPSESARAVPTIVPLAIQAPDVRDDAAATPATPACTAPNADPSGTVKTYDWLHCYTPQQIRSWYGVDQVANEGSGQTIAVIDGYGSPTLASDLQHFHDTFFPSLPDPDLSQVYPLGAPTQTGNAVAAAWTGETSLDVEWSYAIAPLAHIVMVAIPPSSSGLAEGSQGISNLIKAVAWVVANEPGGTVISQSFGVTEQTLEGSAGSQLASWEAQYKAAAEKGDSVLAASGDEGSTDYVKQQHANVLASYPVQGYPESSRWVTGVGGTQLMDGWTWDPTSDVATLPDGSMNPDYFNYVNGGSSEPVWNESWFPAASGGGRSALFPRPPWQSGVASVIGQNARGIPDLAWNAALNGGVLIYVTAFPRYQRAGWHIIGGTSAATPQVAGVIALANEQQAANDEPALGLLNPLLYSVGEGAAFRDVVPETFGTAASGKLADDRLWQLNADGSVSPGPVPGWPVRTGWDMTTGFGTPIAPAFIASVRAARNR